MSLAYSFVIPAYNEGVRIRPTLHALLCHVQEQNWEVEILVVNDGSSDDTAQIVREFGKVHPQVLLLENPGNRGKGYSVRNGMLHARGNICLFTDADLPRRLQKHRNCSTRLIEGRILRLAPAGCEPSCRPNASPSIGRPSEESSTWRNESFWACVSRIRSAGSRLFGETRRSVFFPCRKLNAGDSIPKFFFWRVALACEQKRFPFCGRTARVRG